MFVIRVVELGGVLLDPTQTGTPNDKYIAGLDVEAHDGLGMAILTADRNEAKRFATAFEAGQYWMTQSTTRPFRADGKPNRPLTAFTVTVEPL